MKQREWHNNPKRIRFVRWSRNAAAAFHSVKLVVNIGRLKANVQERIAPKASSLMTMLSYVYNDDFVGGDRDKEFLREEDSLDDFLYLLIKPTRVLDVNNAYN
ncbi:hypothetical protein QYZ87_03535 [Porphyromonadaceae bacterium W3.11]|nr:hypothetical protein [Porphyromonadaceae bacterium W3.11]